MKKCLIKILQLLMYLITIKIQNTFEYTESKSFKNINCPVLTISKLLYGDIQLLIKIVQIFINETITLPISSIVNNLKIV